MLPLLNRSLPLTDPPLLRSSSPSIGRLHHELLESLRFRVQGIQASPSQSCRLAPARLACLFSGGLDCTVICRLAHDLLPLSEPVDLLNVAFENPRAVAAARASADSPYDHCPDRATGRRSHAELQRACPSRLWRFIEVRAHIINALHVTDCVDQCSLPRSTRSPRGDHFPDAPAQHRDGPLDFLRIPLCCKRRWHSHGQPIHYAGARAPLRPRCGRAVCRLHASRKSLFPTRPARSRAGVRPRHQSARQAQPGPRRPHHRALGTRSTLPVPR